MLAGEGIAEGGTSLGNGSAGSRCPGESVEQYEVMDCAEIARGGDDDASFY